MAEQTPNIAPKGEEEAFIPPYYMLILALVGLVVAFIVWVTQPTFSVVGWGGLGIAVLSFFAWVLMAPQQARSALLGRTARFGGTSILVTVIVLVALVGLYTLIRGLNLQSDLTQRNEFSLTEESRTAISGVGADPNIRPVKMIAFYDAGQAGRRDQDTLLFEDYQTTSAGKITFEFVDPDRNPQLAEQYQVTRSGQIAVVGTKEDGQLDVENAQLVNFFSQDELTNAALRVAAQGDFRAFFLNVQDGVDLTDTGATGLSTLNDILTDSYDWVTQEVSIFQITAQDSDIKLGDPAYDGDVVVIVGGSTPLTEEELKVITDYVDAGGNLVIFAAPSINDERTSLATGEALNEYLYNNFGVRFNDDIVLDRSQAFQTPLIPASVDFSRNNYITTRFPNGSGMLFELPRSIEVAPTLPGSVTVDELARSSADAYIKTDLQAVLDGNIDPLESDPKGPLVLAAAAHNTTTGAHVILFGSTSISQNQYARLNNIVNLETAFQSLVWATGFNDFFQTVTIQSAQRPQDTPIFADGQTTSMINILTVFVLPFGVLLIGFLVWWNSRETAR